MDVHPNLAHLTPLVGTWRGRGHGSYPTIRDFDYRDEIEIRATPKPFLHYAQRTWIGEEPMHVETGYLRAPAPGVVELVIAIPTGQSETAVGTCTVDADGSLQIETDATVTCTPAAKQVDRIGRRISCDADTLAYEMSMAAVGQPLTLHLVAELTRAE